MSSPANDKRSLWAALRRLVAFLVLLPALGLAWGCTSEAPIGLEPDSRASMASRAAMLETRASFPVWRQGFEHDTDGWYGAGTSGSMGWCGTIERRLRTAAGQASSAGRAHAMVTGGPCNELWSSLGVPYGGPYGPGPEQSLYSSAWPRGGYVAELDIYLDPAWSAEFLGTIVPGTLIEYGATIFPREQEPDAFHTGPHYFVGVTVEEDALAVLGHRIIEAGWYTFRFVFDNAEEHIRVAFELRDRRGGRLVEDVIEPVQLVGPAKVPFEDPLLTSQWGSGHVWFFDIAAGLQLPIDEYRVRQGR